MGTGVEVFTEFRLNDVWFMAEAAGRTIKIAGLAIFFGSLLGAAFGWLLSVTRWVGDLTLGAVLDVFRSVPLLIQLILFDTFIAISGFPLEPFQSGTLVLTLYASAYVASVARAGIEAVPVTTRRAARSLGMSYWQDMRYIVLPIGLRAVLPSWVGVALGVLKDSALVSVLGYIELLRASQILITRTQEPFIILLMAGAFYFCLSYPISKSSEYLERRWQYD